ncbi:MAG TPA: type 1 glutamine amidotransferase family protein [Ignavibacteriales bacterium]|nr:type 1 glutamine amidotransferase family protein [Ignavibacteriales bacterium]
MAKNICLMYIFDGYSDWEPSYIIAEIHKSRSYEIKTFSMSGEKIVSMGGLTVLPDYDAAGAPIKDASILILPGGDMWETKANKELAPVLETALASNVPVAAICGATVFLANMNLLNNRPHTSNGLDYLKIQSPRYKGDTYYVNKACVTDSNLITANGTAAPEFARDLIKLLGIYDEETTEQWFNAFKYGITQD